MDYEKKYNEALGWMQQLYPCLYGQFREDAERFFPELKESGDEWFIKELQGFLESYGADYFGTGEWQKFHVWLENQKEQEHPCDSAQFEEGFKTGYELGLRKKQGQPQVADASKMEQEVDLEKEIDKGIADYSFTKTIDSGGFKTTVIDYAKIARHFYELGLKARKEE